MLKKLGIRENSIYYVCGCSYDGNAVTVGKRRRWAENAEINAVIGDFTNKKAVSNSIHEHPYSINHVDDDHDASQDAQDLHMGKELFLDTGDLSYREETIEDEIRNEEEALASSQVIFVYHDKGLYLNNIILIGKGGSFRR